MVPSLSNVDFIIAILTLCVLLYMYATRYQNYWKKQNVPYERFSLIIGPTIGLLSKPVCLTDQETYKKMGRLYGIYERGKPALVVAEPDLIKQVLVKDFQFVPNRQHRRSSHYIVDNMMVLASVDRWRTIRPSTSPAFSTGKLRKMNTLIQDCARITCEHLKAAAERKDDIDVKWFFGHYSLDVIARCAFGTEVDSHTDATNEFVMQAYKATSARMTWRVLLAAVFPWLAKYFPLTQVSGSDPFEYFVNVSKRIISERRQNGQRKEDFLQLMMDALEGNLSASAETSSELESKLFDLDSETKFETTKSTKRLTELEAMAQCVLFFVAGQGTTSSTLAFAAYFLAVHPEAQEKLRKEVDDCIATHGPQPSLDVISRLKYMHCVVSETLRLYPPAPRLERSGYDDYVLGDTGIKIPKGCPIVVPIYAMHRDPELFPDPESFKPERFNDENVDSIRAYTYLPFGAGPRNCIGMRLALQSVKLCLLHSLHSIQFVRTEKTRAALEQSEVTLASGILGDQEALVAVAQTLAEAAGVLD